MHPPDGSLAPLAGAETFLHFARVNRVKVILCLYSFIVVFPAFHLAACTVPSPFISQIPLPSTLSTPTPVNVTSPTATKLPAPKPSPIPSPSPSPSPLPTATFAVSAPIAIGWSTYTHYNGLSVQFPVNWLVDVQPNDVVYFAHPDAKTLGPNYTVRLEIYSRPLKDRAYANPYTWQPNEGGYEVRWAKPISIDAAKGLEFVWGAYDGGQWYGRPSLDAIYYSERYELDVRLDTYIDNETLKLLNTGNFTVAIPSRFGVFEYMVNSVRLRP